MSTRGAPVRWRPWLWLALPASAAAAVGIDLAHPFSFWVGVAAGAVAFALAYRDRTTAGILLVTAVVALVPASELATSALPPTSASASVASAEAEPRSDPILATMPVNLSVRHPARWTMTVLSIRVLLSSHLRIDLQFENDSTVFGSPPQATASNTYLEDATGMRYGLLRDDDSWLESYEYRDDVVPGHTVDTFLVMQSPPSLGEPLTFKFADYPPVTGIMLSASFR